MGLFRRHKLGTAGSSVSSIKINNILHHDYL